MNEKHRLARPADFIMQFNIVDALFGHIRFSSIVYVFRGVRASIPIQRRSSRNGLPPPCIIQTDAKQNESKRRGDEVHDPIGLPL